MAKTIYLLDEERVQKGLTLTLKIDFIKRGKDSNTMKIYQCTANNGCYEITYHATDEITIEDLVNELII